MKSRLVRRIVLAGAALSLVTLTIGVPLAGAAKATKVKFTGTISCSVIGSLTATPPITLSSASHKLVLKGMLSACTGNTTEMGVTITGGTLGTTATATASCTSLSAGAPAGSITWHANLPGAVGTTQSFSNASFSVSNGVITVTLPGSGGTAKATGSFAGSTSRMTVVVDQTESTLQSECLGSGVSKLTFTGKKGKSSITVA